MEKIKISDELFNELLIKELAEDNNKAHFKTSFYELLISQGYTIHKARALHLHSRFYPEIINKRSDILEQELVKSHVKAIKKALANKDEHAQNLLAHIDDLHAQIEQLQAVKVGAVKVGGNLVVTTQSDVTAAKKAINALYGEVRATLKQIGDWYGFNTPTKIASTDSEGNDVKPESKLTGEQFIEIMKAVKSGDSGEK